MPLIVLVGLPGSGKTTVGRSLARRLQLPFADSDAVIEQRLGCSIRDYFDHQGEAAFRDFIFQLFSERIADLMQLIEEVAFRKLDQRLAALLLGKGRVLHVTHQQLADELGSVREIVSRLLKSFAEQGLVKLAREQVEIIDPSGLRRMASEGKGAA